MLKPKYYLLMLILAVFGSFIFLESTADEPLDWSESYWKTHNKPFGAEVFHKIFTEYSEGQRIEIEQPPYNVMTEDSIKGNYLFFNTGFNFDPYETDELLGWVEDGNTLLLSGAYFPGIILDTFGLKSKTFVFDNQFTYQPAVALDTINKEKTYAFNRNLNVQYFENTDTLEHEVLGYAKIQNRDSTSTDYLPNFVKIKSGKGHLFIHLFPKAFTNYFLVDGKNIDYTESILKHLDYNQNIYIDQYYKAQRPLESRSLLKYLIGNKHLKWAYYLILLTTILYIIFEGKRKQKAIKVLQPFENKTYAFTRTIADMYYRKKDHKSIATKLIEHFYDYVREQYMIKTTTFDDDFVKQLSSKSGKSSQDIKALLKNISSIESQRNISKDKLIELEKQINKLKK